MMIKKKNHQSSPIKPQRDAVIINEYVDDLIVIDQTSLYCIGGNFCIRSIQILRLIAIQILRWKLKIATTNIHETLPK